MPKVDCHGQVVGSEDELPQLFATLESPIGRDCLDWHKSKGWQLINWW